MPALSSQKIERYEYLTGKATVTYSPLRKRFEKQIKAIEGASEKQRKTIEDAAEK